MDRSFKNKNLLLIVFEVLVVILGIGGITFAASILINGDTRTVLKTGEYHVDYVGNSEFTVNGLEPIDDSLININTTENVIRTEFSLRGVKENKRDDLIYDIMLTDINIDCTLLNKYTKWNLYKNGQLLSSGSFDPKFDNGILSENYHLTDIQQDLPQYNDDYDNYVFIVWISEACDELTSCELVDQSSMMDSKMNMKIFVALYGGEKLAYQRMASNDGTCANKPELYDKMIPITYKDGNFVVTNEDNSVNDPWYDYSSGNWANAVMVNNKKYNVGDVINNEDIIGYYVWIPRYRYKLWNASDEITDSYNALDNGIDIVFESGISSVNGTTNGEYISHPAFGENSRGFWISKYELALDNGIYKFVPNISGDVNKSYDEYNNVFSELNNTYELENGNIHMVNNMEWGATLYLSHSKYGVCQGDGCMSIEANNSYISGANKQDTTTRNVYGVYDMNGSSMEYVAGNTGLGSATNEVLLGNSIGWYQSYITNAVRDKYLRGGINNNLFYCGEESMTDIKWGTRGVINK